LKLPQGELRLTQKYQELTGTFNNVAITDGKMRGEEITFTAGNAQYTGRVAGNSITGTMKSGSTSSNWTAKR
jgi:hypothetical protein